jgi:hypothetical protein
MSSCHSTSFFIIERVAKVTSKERAKEFEQQIDEYQHDLELAIEQTQTIYSELEKLQEEKVLNEKQSIDTIHLLKQDFEEQIEILKTRNIQSEEDRSYLSFLTPIAESSFY